MSKIILSGVVSLLLLSGCTSSLLQKSVMINNEQTKQDVLQNLGTPEDRQFSGENEAWQYCSTGMASDDYVVVYFYKNKVKKMTTYKNSRGGACSSFFRTINWYEKADTSVEIIHR